MPEMTFIEMRGTLQRGLLGPAPDELWPRLFAGEFAACGLAAPTRTISLAEVPAGMLLRWWALCRAAGADERAVCRRLGFSERMAQDLHVLTLAFLRPPKTKLELKLLLCDPLPEEPEKVLDTFCLIDSRWQPARGFWREVCQNREPYTEAQLAVTPGTLLAWGVPARRMEKARQLLLDAVVREPQLNRTELLLGLARELRPLL